MLSAILTLAVASVLSTGATAIQSVSATNSTPTPAITSANPTPGTTPEVTPEVTPRNPTPDDPTTTAITDTLSFATITADKGIIVSMTDTVRVSNTDNISDIINRMPELSFSDNGGLSGLKAVSFRGLGSAHTSIYIDGVRVGNIQKGQTDLGFIDLSHFSTAVVDYAQNSLSFVTAKPQFESNRKTALEMNLKAASWSSYLPDLRFSYKFNDSLCASIYGSGTWSKGNFPYTDLSGNDATRVNNDLKQFRSGIDLFGLISGGDYHAKAYYNKSQRGTPSSIDWPSDDRQQDENYFVQGRLRKVFSSLYTLNLSTKFAGDKIYYSSTWGDSAYDQKEFQLNTAHLFRLTSHWTASVNLDYVFNSLESENYSGAKNRNSLISTFASNISFDRFKANLALEYNLIADDNGSKSNYNIFSPSIDFRFKLTDCIDITAFTRRSFRAPTFNELYYVGYGNPELKAEDAWISQVGAELYKTIGALKLESKVNAFYIATSNKIVSAPDPNDPTGYIWAPYNVGKAATKGIDFSLSASYASLSISGKYAFTDSKDLVNGTAIPFIAKHLANISASYAFNFMNINVDWNIRAGRMGSYEMLKDYNTLDLSLQIPIIAKNATLYLKASNILNSRYEMVANYPMPGRNFLAGLNIKL